MRGIIASDSQILIRFGRLAGYDWNFNEKEWMTTLKLLNMGLEPSEIQVFCHR
jgi:hypothetical protein